ncbi:hypothetical protein [Paenibacillus methanolicus]|uniref:Uncharacterized protein n=1 Tax=Paenibacillus methanolicus TaxID=582686 RepID=A0A5S5BUT4_9BACL|nr:hypothetical protein [Paenibacillus methanolicus]TYP70734.1 hypothetical protein BCM02_111242 [Paenibacillus methanolicus]
MIGKQAVTASNGAANPTFFAGERWLVGMGLLGFALAAFCGIWTLAYGAEVGAEGNMMNAFSFDAALGIFILSTAAVLPLAGMGTRARAFFRWSYIVLALYSYAAETVQNARGFNPRFTQSANAFDAMVGNVFGLVAMLLVLFYVVFATYFFRRKTYESHQELTLALRYTMAAIMISFGAGIWISLNFGRHIGAEGNIIWLHGIGFHALQAHPILAWLTLRTPWTARVRRGVVHAAGISYGLGLLLIGWQTILGRPILEWSAMPVAAGFCFLIGLGVGAAALSAALGSKGRPASVGRGA